jgi:hypothetical protein
MCIFFLDFLDFLDVLLIVFHGNTYQISTLNPVFGVGALMPRLYILLYALLHIVFGGPSLR